jgi:hypothetical protein
MTGVARKDKKDSVACPDGGGVSDSHKPECWIPSVKHSEAGSSTVFVNNIGVVRLKDAMESHQNGSNCAPHAPTLSTASDTVFANNQGVGRKDDVYGGTHQLTSASTNVFANS